MFERPFTAYLPAVPTMSKPRDTAMLAGAEANGYEMGVYRDEDEVRDRNKHNPKVGKDHNTRELYPVRCRSHHRWLYSLTDYTDIADRRFRGCGCIYSVSDDSQLNP